MAIRSVFRGIDQQSLLPSGDIIMIREEIRSRIRILGKNRGYLLAPAHILQADVSTDTIEAMIQAAMESGTTGKISFRASQQYLPHQQYIFHTGSQRDSDP